MNLYRHQAEALADYGDRDAFAYLWEQGTGKTVIALAEASAALAAGRITNVLVVAPKGVHTNWVNREIPKHAPHINAVAWSSRAKDRRRVPEATLFAINYEALASKAGFAAAHNFVRSGPTLLIADESSFIKSPTAIRTRNTLALAQQCPMRRILNGTPIENSPIDLYTQFNVLQHGALGCTKHSDFVATYAQLLPANHPIVTAAAARSRRNFAPQIIARDNRGRPIWRNLDDLRSRIQPWSSRVRKEQCLDLPAKVYERAYFSLPPEARRHYNDLKSDMSTEIEEALVTVTPLTALTKLQQITSGFINVEGEPRYLLENNPRIAAVQRIIESLPTDRSVIIWARFREELDALCAALPGSVRYDGATPTADRERAVDAFQSGEARFFVGNPAAGGRGLTLTQASVVIYASNSFSYGHRAQSEDRAHRIGQTRSVTYIDLIAEDTIDEHIVDVLTDKQNVAETIIDG